MTDDRVTRGRESEVMVANYVRPLFPEVKTPAPSAPGKDLLNTPGYAFEVKARRLFEPTRFVRQAARNAREGEMPLVVARMTGQGEAQIGEWLAFTPLVHMRSLIATAMGRGMSAADSQARPFGPGGTVDQSYELGRTLSEATSTAVFRALGFDPGDWAMEIRRS